MSMNCVLDEAALRKRANAMTSLLKPLLPPQQRLSCYPRYESPSIVLTPSFTGLQAEAGGVTFPTRKPKIRASYREVWIPDPRDRRKFGLDRAYLHVFLRDESNQEKELVLLHCDPNEPTVAPHYRYKAGPHLHLQTAEQPIPHSHIGLNMTDFPQVIASIDQLSKAIASAIVMISEQILDAY